MATSHLLVPESAQYATSNFPQYLATVGSNFIVSGLAFDAATSETCYWKVRVTGTPSSPTLKICWYADTASSGDVIWKCYCAAITPNTDTQDVETKALSASNTATDTHLGTTGQRLHEIDLSLSSNDSMADGDELWLIFSRDASAGGDTMTGDAIVTSVVLSY